MTTGQAHLDPQQSWHAALHRLQQQGEPHVLITQVTSAGSTPREPGARMVVTATHVYDTLGGGTFEWQAIAIARERLAAGEAGISLEAFSLGGRSGQCCGGFVNLLIDVFPGAPVTLALFGAGHVGRWIANLAAPLPWKLLWHDSRVEAFPAQAAHQPRLECRHAPRPEDAVAALPAQVHALVLTHDHGEDYQLLKALLARGDYASLGLIGSASKWASFRSRLAREGFSAAALDRVRCPIGVGPNGHKSADKTPYAIALATVAELLFLTDIAAEAADSAAPSGARGVAPQALRQALSFPNDSPITSAD
ncbi:xanthine dehydrogenase accessory protein XdhC [Halomonas sp. Bachu 37]|uniref:xanthine dehydrogenase accessory protein XdhC n=1 Tax=Halomonas kashgarensis TaxID=3084920 RepID=UPI0032166496